MTWTPTLDYIAIDNPTMTATTNPKRYDIGYIAIYLNRGSIAVRKVNRSGMTRVEMQYEGKCHRIGLQPYTGTTTATI